ncbi:hypothetical protein C8A06_1538 [Microbacteriaceae bacterium MWH-Ta3]|nr:hypothetical protein C8A06_1538 [Microbacteriaceae bacterium MWH-Ta3]
MTENNVKYVPLLPGKSAYELRIPPWVFFALLGILVLFWGLSYILPFNDHPIFTTIFASIMLPAHVVAGLWYYAGEFRIRKEYFAGYATVDECAPPKRGQQVPLVDYRDGRILFPEAQWADEDEFRKALEDNAVRIVAKNLSAE